MQMGQLENKRFPLAFTYEPHWFKLDQIIYIS
jgi:hypothetical protein